VAPCDVASNSKTNSWSLSVAVFKLGHDKTVTKIERSDGTFAVTLETAPGGGLETSVGAKGRISLGKRSFSAGADATASITGSRGHNRTWIVPTEAAADQLVAAIKDHADLPQATVEGHDAKVKVGVGGSTAVGEVAEVSGGVGAVLGGASQTDRTTGNRTYFFDAGVAGNLTANARGADVTASVSGADGDRYALTVAPDGRWLDLAVTRTGTLQGKVDLPSVAAPIVDDLDVPTAGGRRWVSESHLDLTDADNLAAARAAVARLKDPLHPRAAVAALQALSRQMDDHAVVDVRTYAVDGETYGAEGHVGAELKVGGKYDNSTEDTHLVSAATRGIDGQWRVRNDCLKETTT
jgi:hypothetical protein